MRTATIAGHDNNTTSMAFNVNGVGLCKNTQVLIQTTTAHTMKIKTILSSFILKNSSLSAYALTHNSLDGYIVHAGGEKVKENL